MTIEVKSRKDFLEESSGLLAHFPLSRYWTLYKQIDSKSSYYKNVGSKLISHKVMRKKITIHELSSVFDDVVVRKKYGFGWFGFQLCGVAWQVSSFSKKIKVYVSK